MTKVASYLASIVVDSCGGANFPTIRVSLFAEGFFGAECASPRETARSEGGIES